MFLLLRFTCSGLGSSPQRSGVFRPEDLRPVPLLLAVSPRHRSRLAFLQTVGGGRSGSPRSASSVSGSFRPSPEEERMTIAVRIRLGFSLTVAVQQKTQDNVTQLLFELQNFRIFLHKMSLTEADGGVCCLHQSLICDMKHNNASLCQIRRTLLYFECQHNSAGRCLVISLGGGCGFVFQSLMDTCNNNKL